MLFCCVLTLSVAQYLRLVSLPSNLSTDGLCLGQDLDPSSLEMVGIVLMIRFSFIGIVIRILFAFMFVIHTGLREFIAEFAMRVCETSVFDVVLSCS